MENLEETFPALPDEGHDKTTKNEYEYPPSCIQTMHPSNEKQTDLLR
jgi:hypothetical protein